MFLNQEEKLVDGMDWIVSPSPTVMCWSPNPLTPPRNVTVSGDGVFRR